MFFKKPDQISIPNFPKTVFELNGNVSIWWFHRQFAQSSYGENYRYGTNSCTLITILNAELIAREKIRTKANNNLLPNTVVKAFAMAILEANTTYRRLQEGGTLTTVNLNIPEALDHCKKQVRTIQEWFYVHVEPDGETSYVKQISDKLTTVIQYGINILNMTQFKKNHLFVVIIADSRSLLLCIEKYNGVVTIYDSHFHATNKGACIAQVDTENLNDLLFWMVSMFKNMYRSKPTIYELSFLRFNDG